MRAPVVLLLACLVLSPGCGSPDRPLNVVLISLDTLRADHLGLYGYGRDTSPEIDAMAEESLVFEQAYSHSPKTAPSHMTLLTGLLPDAHGVMNVDAEQGNPALGPGIPTLASILRERGYRTAAITSGGHLIDKLGFDRGFDSFRTSMEPDVMGGARGIFETGSDRLERYADADEPFLLFLHTYEIHDPYTAPSKYRELFTDPAYDGAILGDPAELRAASGETWREKHEVYWETVDRSSPSDRQHLIGLYDAGIRQTSEAVGNFLKSLEELGLHETTIVVLLSDHGEEFLEHGQFLHNAVYQEVLHVPLIIRLPERVRRNGLPAGRVTSVVGLVDVLPTLLDLLGIPAPDHLQGSSALGRDGAAAEPRVLSQWPREEQVSLRTGGWKLIQRRSQPRVELYDLASDPEERVDLADTSPDVRDALLDRLRSQREASRELQRRFASGESPPLSESERQHLEALGYLQE